MNPLNNLSSTILLIDCDDEKGLIHKITGVLYKNELNIISNSEFVEKTLNHFYMRTEIAGDFDRQKVFNELKDVLPKGTTIRLTSKRKKDIIIMVTKEQHCLGDILMRNHFNELNANISAVIGNHDTLQDLTSKFNIPFYHVTHIDKSKEEHEAEILKVMEQYKPEFLVLAKYMRILSPSFISRFENRIINIHHSFLPAFKGASPYRQAFERGVKIIGATAHFVNDSLDEGPIIAQSVIPVAHSHSPSSMALAGADVEKIVLAKSLKLVFEERVFVSRNKTIIFD
ncbi:MAG TPA: formyltetrahydrofolate deformylase [Cytophagales bacterium]|nr:formyltetrahydrofolate deformylase [Cytophagales bacterium]